MYTLLPSSIRSRRVVAWMILSAGALLVMPIAAQGPAPDPVDLNAIYRIKEEGLARSKVMETLSYLTDVNGPRLTNSPGMRAAGAWAQQQLATWGLSNVHLEPWGPFGRGWVNERIHAQMIEPQPFQLLAYPKAWTPGTNGAVTGEAVVAVIEKEEDFKTYQGKLKGKFVLVSPMRDLKPYFESPLRRFTDKDLEELSKQPTGLGQPPARRPGQPDPQADFRKKRMEFFMKEGALALIEMSPGDRGDNGAVRVQAFSPGEGSREANAPTVLPQVVVAAEHYGRLVRILDKKVPVKLELDVRSRFTDADLNSFNVVAELPGSDKKDELVMIGAHFDSWHSGTGATDNGVSSAVMMEVMRILKATGLQPRRTIRMALWTGEEQGLLGSRAYVKEHFADRETMTLKPDHAKLSVYLNMDNGGGAFRGVFPQGNEAIAPIFDSWMKPFGNMGMTTLTIRTTGGTDHLSFDAVGLPGFQFVQDPLEYSTRTHHTNLDLYERAMPDDLMQNAVIVASFAYQAAMRDAMMPRKPLPKPQPATPPAPSPTTSASSSR
jgi:carboxypeptidase Q